MTVQPSQQLALCIAVESQHLCISTTHQALAGNLQRQQDGAIPAIFCCAFLHFAIIFPSAGTGVATQIAAAEAGADIVDCAIDSMSGLTSQPSMGAIVNALAGTPLDTGIDPRHMLILSNYW